MGEDHAQAKRALRPALRAARRALRTGDVARRSARACARVLDLAVVRSARHVVLYAATDGEVDVTPLAAAARAAGVPTYYPCLRASDLAFVRADVDALRPGRFGVPEPDGAGDLDPDAAGVVVVVPGLAFDVSGARLGRGGGHYDRALARYASAASIGIAFEFQIMPRLPVDRWDVAMSAVATDARMIGDARRIP